MKLYTRKMISSFLHTLVSNARRNEVISKNMTSFVVHHFGSKWLPKRESILPESLMNKILKLIFKKRWKKV